MYEDRVMICICEMSDFLKFPCKFKAKLSDRVSASYL